MIPLVRLSDIDAGAPAALDLLRGSARSPGALFLDPRPWLTPEVTGDLFAHATRFFRLPPEAKTALDLARSPNFRGYVGVGVERTNGNADLKESFEFARDTTVPAADPPIVWDRLYGSNQWPPDDLLPHFRPALDDYSERIEQVAAVLLRGLARTLDQPVTASGPHDGLFAGNLCSFSRLIYYSDPCGVAAASPRLDAHTDHALFTVILQDAPGLEIEAGDGTWIEVPPRRDALVVFPGELTEFWSRGYYPALRHRVHNSALTGERLSIASFFLPDLRNTVAPVDPASSPYLAGASLGVSSSNAWLADGAALRAVVVGQKEWERIHAIFPGAEVA